MLVARRRQLTASSMAAGELSLRPCFPLSSSREARSLECDAEGESCPVGVVVPGDVMTEEGDVRALLALVPGLVHCWVVEVGEAVLLPLLLSLLRTSWIQCRVASTAAPTVKAMTVVSDSPWGDILQSHTAQPLAQSCWKIRL